MGSFLKAMVMVVAAIVVMSALMFIVTGMMMGAG